jgi:LysM repeat protein
VFLSGILLAPLLLALGWFAIFQVFQLIAPGVHIGGTSLDGLTPSQAASRLDQVWNVERRLTVSDGYHTWVVTPIELGILLDPQATAQSAFQVGHNQDPISEIRQIISSYRNGWGAAPVVQFNPDAARIGLEGIRPQFSMPAKNAGLRLEGAQLVETPAEVGYTINVEETLKHLEADPTGILFGGTAQISLMPLIPAIENVSAVKTDAERLLSLAPIIRAYDPVTNENYEWQVSRETIASWLEIGQNAQGAPVVHLVEDRVSGYVDALNASLGDGLSLDASGMQGLFAAAVEGGSMPVFSVRHAPTVYVVESGDTLIRIGWKTGMPYWRIQQANPDLDPDKLRTGQEIVIPSKDELLPLPVVPGKRIVISISQQRMWLYENGGLLAEHVISTGIDRSPTQPGVFQVQTHEETAYASLWDLYMPHFMGIYEAWPGFMNGIHGLPTLSNGRQLWANILGRPASYGCIILDLDAAEHLFYWAENGVVVEIQA